MEAEKRCCIPWKERKAGLEARVNKFPARRDQMDSNTNDERDSWSVYADPRIFQVSASTPDHGWVEVGLQIDPEEEHCIAVAGTRLQAEDSGPADLAGVALNLKLQEIPRLIAVLNEVYRKNHKDAVASLEFDPGWEFPRRENLVGGQTLTWPIFSRLEPESELEDWKDRRALLEAYKVVADRLADDMARLGLLRPIG
jgi:hypothetical protein